MELLLVVLFQLNNSECSNADTCVLIDNTVETPTLFIDDKVETAHVHMFDFTEFLAPLQTTEMTNDLEVINNFVCKLQHVTANNAYPMLSTSTNNYTLCDKLRHWAITFKPTHQSVTKLLHILSPLHPDLPFDSGTLLRTPTKIKVDILDTGKNTVI